MKNNIKALLLILVLSIINILAPTISKIIISISTTYAVENEAFYNAMNMTSRSINSIYLVLSIFIICYYLIYKKDK